MNEDPIHDDMVFRELMMSAKLELPFADFEEDVMQQIHSETVIQPAVARDIRLSRLFFFFGLACGLLISVLIHRMQLAVLGLSPGLVSAVFQMLFVVLIAIQIEAMILRLRNAKNPTALTS